MLGSIAVHKRIDDSDSAFSPRRGYRLFGSMAVLKLRGDVQSVFCVIHPTAIPNRRYDPIFSASMFDERHLMELELSVTVGMVRILRICRRSVTW